MQPGTEDLCYSTPLQTVREIGWRGQNLILVVLGTIASALLKKVALSVEKVHITRILV